MAKRKNQSSIYSDSSDNSESDLDSEFLNLSKKKNKKKRSPVPKSVSDSDSDNATSKKKPKRDSKSPVSESEKENKNSEPEEGEVSDSSVSDEEFNDGYDDQLMGDEDDRAHLASLTEKERETELFKRIEQRELMKTRFEIEKKLRQARKAERAKDKPDKKYRDREKEKVKEKKEELREKSENENESEQDNDQSELQTDFSSIDHKERSKERKKNIEENRGKVDKRVNAMAELKARREDKLKREEAEEKRKEEQRKKDEEEAEEKKNSIKLKASDIYSDDSDSESDAKSTKGESRQSPASARSRSRSSSSSSSSDNDDKDDDRQQSYLPSRQDVNLIRLSRHKLERFVHMPFFDRIAKGCFVKIGVGQQGNMPVYRVAEIIGVYETAKIYVLGKTRTNKGVRVRHGRQDTVFRLEFISNQEFSDSEYHKWVEETTAAGNAFPSKQHIEQKQADIKEAIHYEFNEQDIERIVREKERFKPNPFNYAMKKTQLMKERDSALSRGDDDVARDLGQKLADLEERATHLDKMRTSTISSISYINNRNRKRNIEEAEKAIMAEVKANKGIKIDDPFTRRSTKPTMNFRASSDTPTVPVAKPAEMPVQKEAPKPAAKPTQVTQDDLFSAHDFDIKIDLEVPLPSTPVNVMPKAVSNDLAPRRSLNLQDYKKKRGLI